jgi:hypothetical protein
MKAKLVDSIRPGHWIYEIKFDGYRALALRGSNETRVLSQNEKDLGKKFPEVNDSVAALDVRDAVIDGEIVALNEKGRSPFRHYNDHTRRAYINATRRFAAWCAGKNIDELARVQPFHVAAFIKDLQTEVSPPTDVCLRFDSNKSSTRS